MYYTYHPVNNSTSKQHLLNISTNTYHPVNNNTSKQHLLNICTIPITLLITILENNTS
ncbi:hypothetical protein CWI36_2662p0010 [Hamiltosporidium magnivora]|uniref:Uncharacterized protein n=1 Tax=Hamiltosporidium magnivora TaxID=148818 RepID=A0A4Q9KTK8_9MICR|nr:hypothetical protein CWI36_2662p0010 [Hamiltosporidium magnivora]